MTTNFKSPFTVIDFKVLNNRDPERGQPRWIVADATGHPVAASWRQADADYVCAALNQQQAVQS